MAPINDTTPPNTQTPKNNSHEPVFAATIDGVRNIPAPTTIPTMTTMASVSDNTCWGCTAEELSLAEIGSSDRWVTTGIEGVSTGLFILGIAKNLTKFV